MSGRYQALALGTLADISSGQQAENTRTLLRDVEEAKKLAKTKRNALGVYQCVESSDRLLTHAFTRYTNSVIVVHNVASSEAKVEETVEDRHHNGVVMKLLGCAYVPGSMFQRHGKFQSLPLDGCFSAKTTMMERCLFKPATIMPGTHGQGAAVSIRNTYDWFSNAIKLNYTPHDEAAYKRFREGKLANIVGTSPRKRNRAK